ncbi:MAG: hypothetical protein IJY20_02185 [Clostridia bacterium]|nr:hypothetical protein [Clostridia bacterium]
MSEKEKKNYGESDSIKAMLERLRRSVTDLPPEVEEEPKNEPQSTDNAPKDVENTLPQQNDVPAEEPLAAETEDEPAPIEETDTSLLQEEYQENVTEIIPVSEEEVVVEEAQSPSSEPSDEGMVLVPWDEDDPLADGEDLSDDEDLPWDIAEDSSDASGTASEEEPEDEDPFFAEEVDDATIAAFFTTEDESTAPLADEELAMEEPLLFDKKEEDKNEQNDFLAEDNLPSGFVDVIEDGEQEAAADGARPAPLITDDEVARLFRGEHRVSEPPAVPTQEEQGQLETVEANEDNGYAVEVEVKRFSSPLMAGYEPVPTPEEIPSSLVAEEYEMPTSFDEPIAQSPDALTEEPKRAATQGLSNGSTIWRDNGARRRPVEVLEATDIDEPPAIADFHEFLGKSKSAEKYDAGNDASMRDEATEKPQKKEKKKVERFSRGVQMTIDDIKPDSREPAAKKKSLFSRLKEKNDKKAKAERTPQPVPSIKEQTMDVQEDKALRRARETAREEYTKERESSATRALAGLYQEEAAAYNEYTSRSQMGVFRRKFESELSFLAIRIAILSFLSVLLLVLENGMHWGIPLDWLFVTPISAAGLHLLLLFFALLCCIPLFLHAWRQLFAQRVVSELFAAIGIVSAILYGAILCFSLIPGTEATAPVSLADVHVFGLLPVAAALVSAIIEFYKVKNDLASFELISSAGDKLACSVRNGAFTKSEAAAIADLKEGEETRVVSVKKVGFTSGFFHRITRNCEDELKNLWLLPTAGVAALLVAVIAGVMGGGIIGACYAFCVAVSLSLPLCTLVLHKLPISTLFRFAAANSCAVVGEVSAIEYSDTDAFAFEDVEAFPARSVRVQRIKLYHESALDHVLYQVAGVFSVLGGPLDGVFRSSTAELGLSSDVRLQQVYDGGAIVSVDGRRIFVGNGDFMLKMNVRMYYDAEDEQILANGKTCIMYTAEEGQLNAKFYIRYRMNEDFERDVERLAANNIRVLIRTFDPNIRRALIDKISYTGRYDLRVVRKTVEQQNDYAAPQINSGIVTRRSVREILRVLLACRRACRLTSFSEMGGLVVGCVGMLVSIIIAMFGVMLSLPSWLLVMYQLLWVLPVMLASKLYITRK